MASLGVSVASDIAYLVLDYYLRGKAFAQTIQDKPLLRILNSKKRTFPGGQANIVTNVQGAYMSDTAGFLVGFSADDSLSFAASGSVKQVSYAWKEMHAGMWITESELKMGGISIVDNQQENYHDEISKSLITQVLQNRMDDFGESWARAWQKVFWGDGLGDSKGVKGLASILTDTPTTGTTGGLNRATYPWWQHRVNLAISNSETNQTLTKFLRYEMRQLRRWGGKPDVWLAGSDFIAALEAEYQAKGLYTMEGFNKENDLGMGKMKLSGLGTVEYEPTLDDLGMSKRCVVFDSKRIYWSPMEGEDNKKRRPVRPYNYFVFLQSMTQTGAMVATQLNCNAVYGIA